MSILFFDTETTGKTNFRMPASWSGQPHLVQLGALLTDKQGNQIEYINQIIKPDGWTIPKEASEVHGITTEVANDRGSSLRLVIDCFCDLVSRAELIVAHNIDFDRLVIQFECHRLKMSNPFAGKRMYCTMKTTTNICKLPGAYGFKWPTLTEAYMHFFGKKFEGAHDAMADVHACRDIYFELKNREPLPLVYLASPYSHPDPTVRHERYESACQVAAQIMLEGQAVFSPIAHSHPLSAHGLPHDLNFWMRQDRQFLRVCDSMIVLQLDGWQESKGVQAEIEIMRELGKPITYMPWPSKVMAEMSGSEVARG